MSGVQIWMGALFNRTEMRKNFFREIYADHAYVEMWGHQWNQLKLELSSEMTMSISQVP